MTKTKYAVKSGAVLIALFLLTLAFSLPITSVLAMNPADKMDGSVNVSYNYEVAQGYPGSGSGSTTCISQTYSSSSYVSGTTLYVSWSGPVNSYCGLGTWGSTSLDIYDSAGTVVYNGLVGSYSGSDHFSFVDYDVIVYVSVTWNYYFGNVTK